MIFRAIIRSGSAIKPQTFSSSPPRVSSPTLAASAPQATPSPAITPLLRASPSPAVLNHHAPRGCSLTCHHSQRTMLGRTAALGLHARMNGSNSSGGGGANNQRLGAANSSRHSRSRSTDSLADLYLPLSPSELVERVWSQTCLYAGLALRLWSFLGLGWKWLLNASRLVLYALLLLPGFMQMIVYYFTSEHVQRDVPYGRLPRQRLDLYVPTTKAARSEGGAPLPAVIFVTGGAWTIGYKAWGALLARRLCDAGVITACLDYRNFPQASALDMVQDVNTGIAWVLRKVERHGGDADRVFLVGQSAGGQLAMLALLNQAAQAASGEAVWGGAPVWHPQGLAGYVGVSGACDLEGLAEHLHRRGLYKNLLDSIMTVDGQVSYDLLSPLHAARAPAAPHLAPFMPPVLLLHGTADKTVPPASSLLMADALQAAGVDARLQLLAGKTHTDLLLEDALAGGRDVLTDSILELVSGQATRSHYPCMCPRTLVRLASWVCPF